MAEAGALRVHVVGGEGGGREGVDGVPAHQLAWDFDLVIATFQQLSSQWSRHREGKADGAPLLQARSAAAAVFGDRTCQEQCVQS